MAASKTSNRTETVKRQASKERASNNSAPLELQEDFGELVEGVQESLVQYGKRHPFVAAGAIFFAGFYVGWKIKPW